MFSEGHFSVTFFILLFMLTVIWVPSFSNLGDLFSYAENVKYYGISLLDFFKAELVILSVVWGVLISYSGSKSGVDGDGYVRRHLMLVMFILGVVFTGSFAGGFLVHQDTSWYQVVRAADDVMPAQAVILLICYPMYLFFGGSAFIYSKTRLPLFTRGKEGAFMVLTMAPLAFLPYHDAGMMGGRS